MAPGNEGSKRTPPVFGHYGEAAGSSSHWKTALFTSSAVYIALGVLVVVIGTATTNLVIEPPPPVPVTFVEKVARPEPPVVVEKPKPLPPLREVKAKPPAAAAAARVPKNMKIRKLDKPAPPKQVVAPQDMPQEAPKEADPSEDKGVAVYGEPGDGDPAGLEGSGGDGAGDIIGFELPDGATAPKAYKTNRRPQYPPSALAARQIGVVKIRCVVKADGWLDEVEVISGDEPFVTEARRALSRWRYEPATHQGQRISVPHLIELRFKLNA